MPRLRLEFSHGPVPSRRQGSYRPRPAAIERPQDALQPLRPGRRSEPGPLVVADDRPDGVLLGSIAAVVSTCLRPRLMGRTRILTTINIDDRLVSPWSPPPSPPSEPWASAAASRRAIVGFRRSRRRAWR